MRNIRSLDDVFDDDRRTERLVFLLLLMMEGLVPTVTAQVVELFIEDIRSKYNIYDNLTQMLEFCHVIPEEVPTELFIPWRHEECPRQRERVLLGDALVFVHGCHLFLFFHQLVVADSSMVDLEE